MLDYTLKNYTMQTDEKAQAKFDELYTKFFIELQDNNLAFGVRSFLTACVNVAANEVIDVATSHSDRLLYRDVKKRSRKSYPIVK